VNEEEVDRNLKKAETENKKKAASMAKALGEEEPGEQPEPQVDEA